MTQTLATENSTLATDKKYRVIQWGIGGIGMHELYSFIEHDAIGPSPDWDGCCHYRVVIEGDPGTELILRGVADAQGNHGNRGRWL
jgi:hypothetical protein